MNARRTSLLVLSLFLASAALAAPAIQFESNRIIVSGVTPKSQVYAYSLSREATGTFSNMVPRETVVSDDDGDGVVTWVIEKEIATRSIWLAVDLASGTPAVATPGGYDAKRIELTDVNLRKEFGSGVGQLAFGGDFVEFVVVRPSGGVWRAIASRGGPADEGADPERATISIEKLERRAGTTESAPKHLRRGDVVLMLNSFRAEYGVITIGE
jgi:hypothetical protein